MINSRNAEKFAKSGNLSKISIIQCSVWAVEKVWFLSVPVKKQVTCIVFVSIWLTVQFYMIVPSKPRPDLACFGFAGAAAI